MNTYTWRGQIKSLHDIAQENNFLFVRKPMEIRPYNWIFQREVPDGDHLELCLIKNAVVFDVFNVYIPYNNIYISSMSYPNSLQTFRVPHKFEDSTLILDAANTKRIIKYDEPTVLIGGHSNHYHWLLNWLPRITVWRTLRTPNFPENVKYAVHYGISDAHIQSLSLIGIRYEDLLLLRPDVYNYHFSDLIIPNFFSSHCYYREVINFLHKYLQFINEEDNFGIYVSRNSIGSPRRRIVNEQDFLSIMNDYNIHVVRLEEMSFLDQIKSFATSWVIIAAHGAGLANVSFSRRGADLLLYEHKTVSEFAELAMLCDIHCHSTIAEQAIDSSFEAKTPTFQTRNRDIIIDIDQLRTQLEHIAKRRHFRR